MVKGRHFFFSLLASEVCSQPPSPPTQQPAWKLESAAWQTAGLLPLPGAGSPCGHTQPWNGAKMEQVDKGPGQKVSSLLHSVEAVAQRRGLTGAQEWGRCFSQRDLEGMCWAYSRATGSLISCPVARVHSVHSWPGPGEEGSIYSGAHLMLPPTPTFFFFSFFKKRVS